MSFKNKIIGISISESENIGALGFGNFHLEDANIEIARHLLTQGFTLAYGGDLRQMGFTEQLYELVNHFTPIEEEKRSYLHSFLGYPIGVDLTEEKQVKLLDLVKFHVLGLPNDLASKEPSELFACSNAEANYYWFRSMTQLRETINNAIDARIVLGGQTTPFSPSGKGYKSKFSGIVEEVLLAMQANKPVYLCGAFGGAAQAVIDALQTGNSDVLKLAHFEDKTQYIETINLYNARHPDEKINFEELNQFFAERGIEGLNNGLSQDENKLLFATIHIPQMVSLVLKGLKQILK
ncbi:hypothetical protein [Runella limosa]|uniref:hypothetical protein n=1 Tax=Runella limosa TaxID=370978 RepID=UPI0004122AB5|nr:hypothetical protein [Runella limosa]